MKRVAILDDYLRLALKMADWSALDGLCRLDAIDHSLQTVDEAAEALAPYHVLCHLRERMPMPRALIERLPNLQCMIITGKSHRTLDTAAATEQGIVLSHVTPAGPGNGATAEIAWGLILSAARHIPLEDGHMHRGGWQHTAGMMLEGRTLGLLGLGRIGQRMARIGQAFGMRVIAWSANLTAEAAAAHGVQRVEKEELFRQADVVSIHLVLSERTHHLVGRAELALMKPEAILVNTSRGPIVDEAALVDALARRQIGGAGLDVYDVEPLPDRHPLRELDNAVLTPHLGYATRETLPAFYASMAAGVLAYLKGQPIGVSNPETLASPRQKLA
ncbi:D-2-hydroxyacid dehydrogenase family protein [Pigmentiphaga soli]|uniref:D-2-hydroxyacid dehydrogenase family protein n=1 Tax=Pigmentiphaga soli TaxID=1007095 RepID=A0ABP8HCN3_9BURK